jgi:hypothetical protein
VGPQIDQSLPCPSNTKGGLLVGIPMDCTVLECYITYRS